MDYSLYVSFVMREINPLTPKPMMLIERMKTPYREELERQLEIYPATLAKLVEELSTKRFYIDMSYMSVTQLGYIGVRDFNPASIAEVFDNQNPQ